MVVLQGLFLDGTLQQHMKIEYFQSTLLFAIALGCLCGLHIQFKVMHACVFWGWWLVVGGLVGEGDVGGDGCLLLVGGQSTGSSMCSLTPTLHHHPPTSTSLQKPRTYVATWLILPVVICLSQRLSHACLRLGFSLL